MIIYAECGGILRTIIGVLSILSLYSSFFLVAVSMMQKRYLHLILIVPVMISGFVMVECVLEYEEYIFHNGVMDLGPGELEFLLDFAGLPYATLAFLCLVCVSVEVGELLNLIICSPAVSGLPA